jgi:hypothetical protein
MTDERTPQADVDELAAHPKIDALAEFVRLSALDAAAARRADFASRFSSRREPAAETAEKAPALTKEEADTSLGNPLSVLERGVETPAEQRLIGALLALGVSKKFPEDPTEQQALAGQLIWLQAHTPAGALTALDAALSERAGALWEAAARVARAPAQANSDFGRTEALVAVTALCESRSDVARRALMHLAQNAEDPLIKALAVAAVTHGDAPELRGELSPAPFGPVITALLAITLLLFVYQATRLIGRLVFAYRRPATLRLGVNGLELNHRTELMGKVLRERAVLVPLSNLARVTREVRYARVGLYVGLGALVLGTYYGMSYFVYGLQVSGGGDRAQLVGMAVLLIVLGLGLDFVLSNAADSARGRCRVVVVPRKGRTLCVGALDPTRTDAMLANIAEAARP